MMTMGCQTRGLLGRKAALGLLCVSGSSDAIKRHRLCRIREEEGDEKG